MRGVPMLPHLPYKDRLTILFCLVDDPSLRLRAGSFACVQDKLLPQATDSLTTLALRP